MALSLSNIVRTGNTNKKEVLAQLAFDSSYAWGGESLTPSQLGLNNIQAMHITPVGGFSFLYDTSNEKVKVYAPAPPVVYGEEQTISSNQITLNYPAAMIFSIATATQSQLLIEPSDTLAANEVQLASAMSAGDRTTLTFHASTSGTVYVSYVTQAWADVWNNRVASVAATPASHVVDVADTLMFIESMLCVGDTGTSRPNWIRGGDAPDSGECEVDWSDAGAGTAGDTTFTFNATDNMSAVTYTGIKLPTSGFLKERFVEDEDTTMSSGSGATAYPLIIPAYCGQIPDYHAAGERDPHTLGMPEGDALGTAGECRIDWHLQKTVAGTQVATNDTTTDAVSMTYIKGYASEIPNLVPLEAPNGSNLSAVTGVQIRAIGY